MFSIEDIQGLKNAPSYEGSKRLTDLLVLTSELPSTQPFVEKFLPSSSPIPSIRNKVKKEAEKSGTARPKMFLTHPGVVGTSIADLNPVMSFFMVLVFYIARWMGSPWHGITPYKGAVAVVRLLLAPSPSPTRSLTEDLLESERQHGKAKWGSAVSFSGQEYVGRTEVEGWGFGGKVGTVPEGSVNSSVGKFRGWREVDDEARVEFEETGRTAWREMEGLREEWERRLGWEG
jgi:3-keto steroid reductase